MLCNIMPRKVSYYHDETIATHAHVEASLVKPHILK